MSSICSGESWGGIWGYYQNPRFNKPFPKEQASAVEFLYSICLKQTWHYLKAAVSAWSKRRNEMLVSTRSEATWLVQRVSELCTFSYEWEASWQHPQELALNWKWMVGEVSDEVEQNGHRHMRHTDITPGRATIPKEKQHGKESWWKVEWEKHQTPRGPATPVEG